MKRPGTRLASLALALGASAAATGTIAAERELLISVAVSLRPAVGEIADLYRATEPEIDLTLNSAASGVLTQQALRGAPVDLLISASPTELDRLERAGRLQADGRAAIAGNRLIVLLPHDSPSITDVRQLERPGFDRIAVGNPATAPVGRYTAEALATLGLEVALATRLVRAESARQVVEYVARGEAAAGLCYRTDARLAPGRVRAGPELPADSHTPILYQAGLLTEADPAAADFLALLLSTEGQAVFRRHGFPPAPLATGR